MGTPAMIKQRVWSIIAFISFLALMGMSYWMYQRENIIMLIDRHTQGYEYRYVIYNGELYATRCIYDKPNRARTREINHYSCRNMHNIKKLVDDIDNINAITRISNYMLRDTDAAYIKIYVHDTYRAYLINSDNIRVISKYELLKKEVINAENLTKEMPRWLNRPDINALLLVSPGSASKADSETKNDTVITPKMIENVKAAVKEIEKDGY